MPHLLHITNKGLSIMVLIPFMVVTVFLMNFSSCLSVVTYAKNQFEPALATWYGNETGGGSGGACGWGDDVKNPPLSSMISAGNANIFLKGKGCGHCFQILCRTKPYCSGQPITVTISDECPGACNNVPFHFDLSAFAFGAMANPGEDHNLRLLGQVDVEYKRVPCSYGGTDITFKVSEKCNPEWFAVAVEYADGDGGYASVEIATGDSESFLAMDNQWGAVWKKDIDSSFQPPYSFRLTSADRKTVVASNVIPQNFAPGQTYSSNVNFN